MCRFYLYELSKNFDDDDTNNGNKYFQYLHNYNNVNIVLAVT
jgi:hypothetical protein